MHKLKYLLILIIIMLVTMNAADRITNVGTTSASFLEVGVGARAISMGGAYVAVANDVSSLYWNPGGLGRLKSGEFIFERIDWLAEISFNYFGAVIPMGRYGTLGAYVKSMTMPLMKVRTLNYPDGTGERFGASAYSFGLSFGRMLTDRFSIGANLKYIREEIWHEQAATFAVDLGIWYQTPLENLRFGASITNYGPEMQLDGSDLLIYHDSDESKLGNNERIMGKLRTEEWPLPLNVQVGLAYGVFENRYSSLTIAADAFHPINNSEGINTGAELAIVDMIYLRAGYKAIAQVDSEEGLTAGVGLQYKLFGQSVIKFDYAYTEFGRLEYTNRYTLRLNF